MCQFCEHLFTAGDILPKEGTFICINPLTNKFEIALPCYKTYGPIEYCPHCGEELKRDGR